MYVAVLHGVPVAMAGRDDGAGRTWRYWLATVLLVSGPLPTGWFAGEQVNVLFAFMTPLFVHFVLEIRRRSLSPSSLVSSGGTRPSLLRELIFPQSLGLGLLLLGLIVRWFLWRNLPLQPVLLAALLYYSLWSLAYLLSFDQRVSSVAWVVSFALMLAVTVGIPLASGQSPRLGKLSIASFQPIGLWIALLLVGYLATVTGSWLRLNRLRT